MSTPSTVENSQEHHHLGQTIDLLGTLLGEAIVQAFGHDTFYRVESLRLLCKEVGAEARLAEIRGALSRYSITEMKQLIHSFSVFFLLSNQAEQCEIIRIKRRRSSAETRDNPRAESIAEAVRSLSRSGLSLERLRAILSEVQVIPTITAHPTESRRRSVLLKQLKIAKILFELSSKECGELDTTERLEQLKAVILELLVTDDVRAKRLSVHDEVENGIFFLAGSILEVVPHIMKDIVRSVGQYFNETIATPAVVRYRSWIGGDRDGNPNVTSEVTKDALLLHRAAILKHYLGAIRDVRNELSISVRKVSLPESLTRSIEEDRATLGLANELIDDHQIFEPLREKCGTITLKLQHALDGNGRYTEHEFMADLAILESALVQSGLETIARAGALKKLIDQAKVFGFSLADIDLRQHSKVHQAALAELLRAHGLCANYSALSEGEKVALIHSVYPSNLTSIRAVLSAETTEALAVLKLVHELQRRGRSGVAAYIISMTHSVSDMLEPLLLWKFAVGNEPFPLDLVPLFETIEDLDGSEILLEAIITDPLYRQQLARRGDFQEVMLGYSDSNKDGGYLSANVLLYEAQLQIAQVCNAHGIRFQIFHGRGGSVGRGGGRAGRAILSSPPESHSGKVRFTEQGEVISFRYSMPELAHRHLEQIVSAVILSAGTPHPSLSAEELKELKELSEISRLKYRSLIDAPGFWEWYVDTTPINFISSLPIASRPVMRAGANLEFENLRAIPWVFSWTQKRYNVPSWYGLGSALQEAFDRDSSARARFKALYREKIFFRSLIDNAQQEMARARLIIAKQYDVDEAESFHSVIAEEFRKSQEVILEITGQKGLLENNPVIKRSIELRNPYTDTLNLIQAELLQRVRNTDDAMELAELKEAIHMSINGLAAAMQTTG